MEFFGFFATGAIFIVMIVLYFLYVTRSGKGIKNHAQVDLSIIPVKWNEVQVMMQQGGPANFRQAIMDGDKLVDLALKAKVSGETMGDRLKNARHLFGHDTYDKLWTAHKIRNKVAHEADFEGLSYDARLAVNNFEKALKELRVI